MGASSNIPMRSSAIFRRSTAIVDLSPRAEKPEVGDVVNVVPNHCCVVSNMVDEVYAMRDGAVESVWPVAASGKVR